MKKLITWIVIIIVIIVAVVAIRSRGSGTSTPDTGVGSTTPPVAVSETTQVSNKLKEYQNAELGFSVKYPNDWDKIEGDTGVSFLMPIDPNQVSTVNTLKGDITISGTKCSFGPLTTVKDRGTLVVPAGTLSTLSMNNSVQGRTYFNRLYTLQKGDICYLFSFSAISQSTTSKNLTGSQKTQAENNNKAIVNSADAAFTDMVKSFTFVASAQGQDESTIKK